MKPWKPTQEHIRSMIMATGQGYGITEETTGDNKRVHLIIWKDGKEHARYTDDDTKGCLYQAYAAMVREGKIKP